ncbi:glucose dehydrogenase [FAD, quinone]-like [Diprion similis]|uniref:glucose dehydrogenase [FAD, quinone]-like n=1 Tax=Diprion similis TaxID=362088 RepID=UPI001EF76D02|nr:glucose dehydrogenase [FAD, quinone]-like [Diprion similis]
MYIKLQLIVLLSVRMTHHLTLAQTCNERQLPGPSLVEMCSTSDPNSVMFMSVLDSLIQKNEKISGACERVTPIEVPDPEYNFIVVGGGAGGSVVAARLSEISDWKVLLLEAGDDEPAAAQIPSFAETVAASNLSWGYQTSNETHACLSSNGSCQYAAARVLGGCTVHNGMVYLRGNPTDYNNWAAMGNEGWTWDEVKPFFLKAEDNGEIDRVGRFWHATGGPLSVERPPYHPPFADYLLKAAEEAGFRISQDFNGDVVSGFGMAQATMKNGVRRSSAASYLRPVRNHKNLHISLNSTVTRVIIENRKAVGVEYFKNGEFKTVRTSQEVILSAGTIRSPHILLLSGIGPKEHLVSMGIKVVKDLPGVGSNYHDHPFVLLPFNVSEPNAYENNWEAAAEYLASQTGPLSSHGITAVVGQLVSSKSTPDFPDMQIYNIAYDASCAPGDVGALRSTRQRTVDLAPVLLHPKSRGRISLASNDPLVHPRIWSNMLSEPSDVDILIEAVNSAIKLTRTEAMKAYNLTLAIQVLEPCSNYTYGNHDFWRCMLRYGRIDLPHGSGTCKMGPKHDVMAVVDHKLRVRGIKGLRVADTSIMPEIVSANTATPTMMIGERAADFIKKASKRLEDRRMEFSPTYEMY